MSRVAKTPIVVPNEVDVNINDRVVTVIGKNGKVTYTLHSSVKISYTNNTLTFFPRKNYANGWVHAGTTRAILNSMIVGVTKGFTKKLQLIGVGYRATIKDNIVTLSLGFSHSISYRLPIDITAELPSQTEIVLRGANKQMIGQIAANLRAYRPPEPYKGKGIRYASENIRIKEAKKK